MRTVRTLALRKESLTELTTEEMTSVAGGQLTWPCPYSLLQCTTVIATRIVSELSAALADCPLG
jgi:hypothetical protein